jgi:hypothetical protein
VVARRYRGRDVAAMRGARKPDQSRSALRSAPRRTHRRRCQRRDDAQTGDRNASRAHWTTLPRARLGHSGLGAARIGPTDSRVVREAGCCSAISRRYRRQVADVSAGPGLAAGSEGT